MRKAKEMNYEGSLLDLFKEAEAGGFANDINKPKKSTYVDARSGYGFPTTYEEGGYKKEGEVIPNDEVAGTTETISRRQGLDNMPNSLELFLSKKHVLSSSDLEIKASVKEMQEGGISDIVTDYDSVWEYAKQGDNFLTRRKGSNSWITATGDAAASISRGVYNLGEDNETQPTTPFVNPTPVLKDMEKSENLKIL